MPIPRRARGPYLGAVLLGAASLTACSADDTGSNQTPIQPAAGGMASIAGSGPLAGSGGIAGMSAGAGASGTSAGVAGMLAAGTGGLGAAGAAGAAGAGTQCGSTSADGDDDGTPDCMDMCPMDAAKTAPGMCGCGEVEDANMNGDPDCMEAPGIDPGACQVAAIPADVRSEWELDPFYTRYASADGIPIVATDNPEDEAIARACKVVMDLSSTVPMAREHMRTNHVYFIMMAAVEKTVQTPEYRSRGDLDARARGFGNNPGLCAEENVMCDRSTDRWRGESICVHEYSHVMHLYVWNETVPDFNSKVNAAYQNAVRTMGLYRNTYAASNAVEYFAEGVQNWYNTNLEASASGNGVHNHINTRPELQEYDPMLYELLATVLPDQPAFKDCYYYEPE
jgi:hypothetical protein